MQKENKSKNNNSVILIMTLLVTFTAFIFQDSLNRKSMMAISVAKTFSNKHTPTPSPTNTPVSTNTPMPSPTPSSTPIPALCNKEIQGWYQGTGVNADIDYSAVTTIAYSSTMLNSNGTTTLYTGAEASQVISRAHSSTPKVKVVLTLGCSKGSTIDKVIRSSRFRTVLVNDLYSKVQQYGFDGVDVDLEFMSYGSQANMNSLMKELNAKFRASKPVNFPSYRLSIATSWDPIDVSQKFDLSTIQTYVDYVTIMFYDVWGWGSNSGLAGPNSPYETDNGNNIGYSMIIPQYYSMVPKDKLLLGVPWYGYDYLTSSSARLASGSVNGSWICYKDYINAGGRTRNFDSVWKTPWWTWPGHQFHGDDTESLGIKYDFVNSQGLAGIGIWEIGCGTGRSEIWQGVKDKFCSVSSPVPLASPTPSASPTSTS